MKSLLNDSVYRKMKKDPTPATERKVLKEVRQQEGLVPNELGRRLKPSASLPPKLYGLPKIHKPDVPLRPIVSSIGSPTYQLSKHITELIAPLTGQTDSFVQNSKHFVEMLSEVCLQPEEVMVSFDVKSLFTNVPVSEALEVTLQGLREDSALKDRTLLPPERITHLLELCLRTTYFTFRSEFFQQQDGAAMGSPVSPVDANIYMEMFEDQALSSAQNRPRTWKRYVDDTFCIMEKRHVKAFLVHLNSLRPSIQFTMEMGENNSLPFLDTLVKRGDGGMIDFGAYRKPTHTDRYLQYSSHHPCHVKRGMVSGLFHRARAITQGQNREREEEHLTQVLQENGYPYEVVRTASRPRLQRTQEEQSRHTLYIPYVSGLGEDLRRVCRKYNIRTVFRTSSTVRQELSRTKDRDPPLKTSGVVYGIHCICGLKYIGETKRALEMRLKEHQAATRRGETEKSAIIEHAWSQHHQPLWEETRVLDWASHNTTLLIKEAIHISLRDSTELLNRDWGLAIDCCWKHLVSRQMTKKAAAEQSRPR